MLRQAAIVLHRMSLAIRGSSCPDVAAAAAWSRSAKPSCMFPWWSSPYALKLVAMNCASALPCSRATEIARSASGNPSMTLPCIRAPTAANSTKYSPYEIGDQ